jgi:hypothetical protein
MTSAIGRTPRSVNDEILAHHILYRLRDNQDWSVTDLYARLGEVAYVRQLSSPGAALRTTLDQLVAQERIELVGKGVYHRAPPAHTVSVGIHCADKHCSACDLWSAEREGVFCQLFREPLEDDGPLGSLRLEACLEAEESR